MTSKISSQVTSKYHKEGVYYTGFTKQYHSLTVKELSVQEDLIKSLVSDYEHITLKYMILEHKKIKYSFMSRYEVYYVRNFGQYIGKASVSIQDIGNNHFDLTIIYYYKRDKLYHNMKLKPIKPFEDKDDKVVRDRYTSRRAHRIQRTNRTTRGIKST